MRREPDFEFQYLIERHHPLLGWHSIVNLMVGMDEYGARRQLADYRHYEPDREYRLARRPVKEWEVLDG